MKLKETNYDTDPGSPEDGRALKQKQLRGVGLLNNDSLMKGEDSLDGKGHSVGGFLKRHNFGDRN